jgi:hypothetical protein
MRKPFAQPRSFVIATIVSLFTALQSWALTAPVKALVDMETKANGAGIRSNEAVAMPHYEIPLRLLREDKEFTLDPKIYESLVFEKDGELYVRWVVNPEDTQWFLKVEGFMRQKGLTPERKTHFTGYMTASRSYIVEDPKNHVQFSIKSSTNKTGGAWRDKKQEYGDGFDIRVISDLVARIQKQAPFKHVVVMQEPLTFGIKEIDQSIVVRDLAGIVKSGDFIYAPGFSVLHEELGREIARKNGSDNPYEFWTKNYVEPVARAAAEFSARTGLWYDSPHGQNFLVEMDKNYKPTGRIVLRDLGDVYVAKPILKAMGEGDVLKKFNAPENVLEHLSIAFGPLHGNQPPTWISAEQYRSWEKVFGEAFSQEMHVVTGIPQAKVKPSFFTSTFSYMSTTLQLNTPEWMTYLSNMKRVPKMCLRVLMN